MTANASQELVIEAGRKEAHYWRDVWRHRELLVFLAWRDIMVRYKQTVIGVAWAWLRPLVTVAIFTMVFGLLAKLPSTGVPYPVLVFAGLLPWQFFSGALSAAAGSLVDNVGLVSKVYFPRVIVPASAIIVSLVDFAITTILLMLLMAWYKVLPDWRIVTLPFFVLMAALAAIGIGLGLGALNVKYRDFRHIVPFIVQIGLYASPVGFSMELIPERWRLLYALNPMAGVIEGFRWALLRGQSPLTLPALGMGCATILVLLVVGLRYFRATEKSIADVI